MDWKGEKQQKTKRGFATKREALEWERQFLMKQRADIRMTFESFAQLYEQDVKPKLKLNTWLTKESIIRKKILSYFGKRMLSEITAKDVIQWQNEVRKMTDSSGNPYSQTYLKTVHNQLSAIFNHAVRHYDLPVNPAAKAGNMGTEEKREMLFWTKDEYLRFADAMMDKPVSYYAFEMLYWCGIHEGELLALTPEDFDFAAETVSVSKSYQRLQGQDVITTPKTKKSVRTVKMPEFLCEEMRDYLTRKRPRLPANGRGNGSHWGCIPRGHFDCLRRRSERQKHIFQRVRGGSGRLCRKHGHPDADHGKGEQGRVVGDVARQTSACHWGTGGTPAAVRFGLEATRQRRQTEYRTMNEQN